MRVGAWLWNFDIARQVADDDPGIHFFLEFSKFEIDNWLKKIEEKYNPVALKMSQFSSITGKKLYFLPRKLETRCMIFRKSRVAQAVKEWYKFRTKIVDLKLVGLK